MTYTTSKSYSKALRTLFPLRLSTHAGTRYGSRAMQTKFMYSDLRVFPRETHRFTDLTMRDDLLLMFIFKFVVVLQVTIRFITVLAISVTL